MKKILVAFLLLSTLSFSKYSKYLEVKVGKEVSSTYDGIREFILGDVLSEETKNSGYKISLEGMMEIDSKIDLGLGIAYHKQADRKVSHSLIWDYRGSQYDSVPLYLVGKYKFLTNTKFTPYVKFNVGYAFLVNKESLFDERVNRENPVLFENKGYFAIGGGLEYDNFVLEIMYSETKAKYYFETEKKNTFSTGYNNIILSAGYKFNF